MSTQRDPRALLDDILRSAAGIERVLAEKTLVDYQSDEDLQSIVERRFTIIGEALKRLERTDIDLFREIPDARDIVDFRNVLAHGYEVVDHQAVWAAAREDLLRLVAAVTPMLARLE
ncbi:MAG TPA: HepT-like ribonuclease domain-containing protein [Thermoanaerobaculia bacterium]|jgi:uncharacterized protein with HEPN domain|nr:HepT-like ribonuclease domain-containing protein [Thermoanaerobaculia bacterium]